MYLAVEQTFFLTSTKVLGCFSGWYCLSGPQLTASCAAACKSVCASQAEVQAAAEGAAVGTVEEGFVEVTMTVSPPQVWNRTFTCVIALCGSYAAIPG